jgi:hypothetical protein
VHLLLWYMTQPGLGCCALCAVQWYPVLCRPVRSLGVAVAPLGLWSAVLSVHLGLFVGLCYVRRSHTRECLLCCAWLRCGCNASLAVRWLETRLCAVLYAQTSHQGVLFYCAVPSSDVLSCLLGCEAPC